MFVHMMQSPQAFNTPPPRKSKTKYKCDYCRSAKLGVIQDTLADEDFLTSRQCSFGNVEPGHWPKRCDRCKGRNSPCSEPRQKSLKRKITDASGRRPPVYQNRYESFIPPQHIAVRPLVTVPRDVESVDLTATSATDSSNTNSKEASVQQ